MKERAFTLDVKIRLTPSGRIDVIKIPFTPQLARRKEITESYVLNLACKAKYPFGSRADVSRWRKEMTLVSPIETVMAQIREVGEQYLSARSIAAFREALRSGRLPKYDAMSVASSGGGRFRY